MRVFRVFVVIALALTIAFGILPAPAQAETVTNFIAEGGGAWDVPGNWSFGVPDASKRAVILNDPTRECVIPLGYDAVAKKITIKAGSQLTMSEQSTLVVSNEIILKDDSTFLMEQPEDPKDGAEAKAQWIVIKEDALAELRESAVLTLGEESVQHTSTIVKGGVLQIGNFAGNATLKISGDHTIIGNGPSTEGEGGTILLVSYSVIDDNGHQDDELTIEGSCNVTCDINDKPEESCSLTVTGEGTINVKLYNDAFVVVDNAETLTLDGSRKDSGCCGFWIARYKAVMEVYCNVGGAATWVVDDPDAPEHAGWFQIGDWFDNHACAGGTGNVILKGGGYPGTSLALEVRSTGHFCTTGKLVWKSVPYGEQGLSTSPEIFVAEVAVAQFGISDCTALCLD